MNTQTEMNKQSEMKKMMTQYLEYTYKDKNVLKTQKCRWNKRLLSDLPKNHTGSTATLMHMLDFMIYQKNTYNNFIKFIISNSINMPVKSGKDKGLLTTAEIRRLISAHNKLSKIVVPKGTDRNGLEQLIKSSGYKINHKEQRLDPQPINRPPLKIINMPEKKPSKPKPEDKAKTAFKKKLGLLPDDNNVSKPTFNVKNTKVAQVKNKPPVKVVNPYAQTTVNKDLEDYEDRLKDMSEVIVNNKNNFGANGGEKAFKKIDDLFKEVKTIGGGIDNLQKKSPKTIKYFTNILNSIHRHPPTTNEGVILPQLERFKIWNRYISESAKKDRAKIMKERKDALKPKKEKVKKPTKEDKALQKKLDYDQKIEERLKKLDDDLKLNKNVLTGFVANKQGDFIKLFTDIYKLGKGIVPKDFSTESLKYATNLLNIVYSNPPINQKPEGLVIPEQTLKPNGGIFHIWKAYLTESAKKDRVKIIKDALKPSPPPVEEDDESEDEEDARLKRKEITARNDPLTDKLRVVISMKDKILKKVKNDPTLIQGETARKSNKLIGDLVKPILEYIKKLENDNNIRFSESILDQYQLQLIQNLRSDLKEFMK